MSEGLIILADSSRSQFEARPSGHVLLDGVVVGDTVRCCHGGEHFLSVKGSGATRGFCVRCGGRTCGAPAHDPCMDWRKKLDLYERGQLGELR